MRLSFPASLKARRARLKLSMEEAARLLDMPIKHYEAWEAGKVADVFKVTREGALARFDRAGGRHPGQAELVTDIRHLVSKIDFSVILCGDRTEIARVVGVPLKVWEEWEAAGFSVVPSITLEGVVARLRDELSKVAFLPAVAFHVDPPTFRARLADAILAQTAKFSRADIADLLGVSLTTIQRWLNGAIVPNQPTRVGALRLLADMGQPRFAGTILIGNAVHFSALLKGELENCKRLKLRRPEIARYLGVDPKSLHFWTREAQRVRRRKTESGAVLKNTREPLLPARPLLVGVLVMLAHVPRASAVADIGGAKGALDIK